MLCQVILTIQSLKRFNLTVDNCNIITQLLKYFVFEGGTFPMPPAAAHLNSLLPSSVYFQGPFVGVDKLMEVFQRLQLPEKAPSPNGEGADQSQFDLAKSLHWVINPENDHPHPREHHFHNHRGGKRGFKRKGFGMHGNHDQRDSDDDDSNAAPPINDIYRIRQQKRVK